VEASFSVVLGEVFQKDNMLLVVFRKNPTRWLSFRGISCPGWSLRRTSCFGRLSKKPFAVVLFLKKSRFLMVFQKNSLL
jgi:hypothetical protein